MRHHSKIWTAGIAGATLGVAFTLVLGSQLRGPAANASAPSSIAVEARPADRVAEAFKILSDHAAARVSMSPTAPTADGF